MAAIRNALLTMDPDQLPLDRYSSNSFPAFSITAACVVDWKDLASFRLLVLLCLS
jgi:hypothetical protein